ncbi:sigma 54-interacting transcriptional regulator [Sodalinema gerasimenkoae]|uniref:sigma 54-interacting transcriptional regulator n=1 Tax=Sodalinema gerasimenkoae TaxID=2862348 RepID=UPI00135A4DEC|nr:sigma 54-interacting transcriptional regulator [Sodalinema gerasimenkoae]
MIGADRITWLKTHTILQKLSEAALADLNDMLSDRHLAKDDVLSQADQPPDGIYILHQGQLQSDRPQGSYCLTAGTVLHLQDLLLERHSNETLTALSESQLWQISREDFSHLLDRHNEISRLFSQQLAAELDRVSAELTYERQRQSELRPYLVNRIRRGIIGTSRYAVRLRQSIKKAAKTQDSVLIFGEPGLEKDNMASLIHYGSPQRREPMIQLTSGLLQTSGAELFGRVNGKPGLLEWLGEGTLVLNNVQDLPDELREPIAQLLKTQTYHPVFRDPQTQPVTRSCNARIILISERAAPEFTDCIAQSIKVPPVRVRKTDIKALLDYNLSLCCRSRGIPKPRITPEAIRRLQSYDFPNNLRELSSLVKRAVTQADGANELTEELFWSQDNKKTRLRLNLFKSYPQVRQFLRGTFWTDGLNYGITTWVFALVVILLFVGPQTRDQNVALNLFWAWWWPLILLGFPFVGRLWCAVCPFMIYGELSQKLSLKLFPRKLKPWQRQAAERWGGWFLFGLFALIFLWEELWHLQNTAYLSSCLLLLITAGAVIFSLLFERRFWCRYLCPIGGMNGLFAKLSMTELRAQTGICSAECTTYQCYKGGPEKGEGQETEGCPLYSHPAQLQDNRDCVLCMTCLKACPHRSVELNLRPPGIELWTTHTPHSYEVALLFLLLGGVFLRRLPELQGLLGWSVNLGSFGQHLEVSLLALLLPAIAPLVAYALIQAIHRLWNSPKPKPFMTLAYGYLPLVWGGNLAHYLHLGLGEAGRVLPVTLATFGMSGANLPIWVADPAVISFLQGTLLIVSTLLSLILTQKIARKSWRFLLPQHLSAIALGWSLWAVILP